MLVFVNRFSVHGAPADFERAFEESSEFMRRQPGFLWHRLVRSAEASGQYLNIAEWEDESSFRQAVEHPEFAVHVSELRELATTDPHLYLPVVERHATP